jgi:hypothetical protein
MLLSMVAEQLSMQLMRWLHSPANIDGCSASRVPARVDGAAAGGIDQTGRERRRFM